MPQPLIVGIAAAQAATSITLPPHRSGDLVLGFITRNNATPATKPAAGGTVPTWLDKDPGTANGSLSTRLAYFVASASNHTSGTWTNATAIAVVVIRGADTSNPFGGFLVSGGSASGSGIAPAVTLSNSSGTSLVLHFLSEGLATAWPTDAPAGYTRRVETINTACLSVVTRNNTTSAPALTQTMTTSTAVPYQGTTIEILPGSTPFDGIGLIGVAPAVNATSITLPDHIAGDLIVIEAGAPVSGSVTPANGFKSRAGNAIAGLYLKVAQSSSETSGTWTGTDYMSAAVYRGVTDVQSGSGTSGGNNNTISYNGFTLDYNDGTSWVLAGGRKIGATNHLTTIPAGLKFRSGLNNGGLLLDTDAPVTSYTTKTQTVNATNVNGAGHTVELIGKLYSDISTLFDAFLGSSLDTGKWTASGPLSSSVANDVLTLPGSATVSYAQVQATSNYKLKGSAVSFQTTGMLPVPVLYDGTNGSLDDLYRDFTSCLSLESNDGVYSLRIVLDANRGVVPVMDNGTKTLGTFFGGHTPGRAYRIRESSGTVYFEHSTDGTNWITWYSTAFVFDFDVWRVFLYGANPALNVDGVNVVNPAPAGGFFQFF